MAHIEDTRNADRILLRTSHKKQHSKSQEVTQGFTEINYEDLNLLGIIYQDRGWYCQFSETVI